MAYFSCGTEALDYQARFCERCVHDRNRDCPVWALHLLNTDTAHEDDSLLHVLIPQSEDGLSNEQCRLFVATQEQSP